MSALHFTDPIKVEAYNKVKHKVENFKVITQNAIFKPNHKQIKKNLNNPI